MKMVRFAVVALIATTLNLSFIGGKKSAWFSKGQVSCKDNLNQKSGFKNLLQCCGYCLQTENCEAVNFENELCSLFSDLMCCEKSEDVTELFVSNEVQRKLIAKESSTCKLCTILPL